MAAKQESNRILLGSMLGLVCGLFMLLAGRAIIDAVNAGTYQTVFGIEVITTLVATIGGVICIGSILGMIIGIFAVFRKK